MTLDLKNLSILIVEDTLPMQRLIASVIENLGFTKIYLATNGIEGFDAFRKFNPDIVLSDWLMEPGDGLELTQKIRHHPTSPNRMAPVILITGYSSLPRVNEARDQGVTEFLVKPFTAADIAKRISYVINNPRDFIATRDFFGPDRRRKNNENYKGPRRRASERSNKEEWTLEFRD